MTGTLVRVYAREGTDCDQTVPRHCRTSIRLRAVECVRRRRRRRRSLLGSSNAREAIPDEVGSIRCRVASGLKQSADETMNEEEEEEKEEKEEEIY